MGDRSSYTHASRNAAWVHKPSTEVTLGPSKVSPIQADGKASTTISCQEVLLALVLTPALTNVNSRKEKEDVRR